MLSCCAADGIALQVRIVGAPRPLPPDDTWLAVEGTWQPRPEHDDDTPHAGADDDTDRLPILVAATLREIPPPDNPYEG